MPELPEVEVVRRGIVSHLVGARIDDVRIFDIRALKRHQGSAESFRDALTGATVLAAVRRGKFVWCPLDSGAVLVAHLGMSGQFRVPGSEPLRHERVRLVLAGRPDFSFVDQRLFGSLAVDATACRSGLRGTSLGLVPGYHRRDHSCRWWSAFTRCLTSW